MAEQAERSATRATPSEAAPELSAQRHEALERRAHSSGHEALLNSRRPATKPRQPAPNRTGLPDRLKAGAEALSGISLEAVKVHYNSPKPAQLDALAFAQGTEIHLGPGQERHLPHEAWHVVQQAQGRVKPTATSKRGLALNNDDALEREADKMGAVAAGSYQQPLGTAGAEAAPSWRVDVAQRVDIVGNSEDPPHPTQDEVNEHIVAHKVDAIQNERYEVTYSAVAGQRHGEETTLISDGHHAYVASQLAGVDIDNEESGAAESDITWEEVSYSPDVGWYEDWLESKDKVDVARAEAVAAATDDDRLQTAWDALEDWEKRAIDNSDLYEYVREAIEENDLSAKFDELRSE